jgi:hypothetical protein
MARPERFELPTYSSGGCRSIQLSYGRADFSLHPDSGIIKCRTQSGSLPGSFVRTWLLCEGLPAAATATTAAFPSTTSAAAAPASALWFGTGFVHIQSAPAHL